MASNVNLTKLELLAVRDSTDKMESLIAEAAKRYYPMMHPGRLTKIQIKAIIAAEMGDTLVLKFIVSSANVSPSFKFRWRRDPSDDVDSCCTLLDVACYFGQPTAAVWLIEAGAPTLAPTAMGWFPETAVAIGWEEIGEEAERPRFMLILQHLLHRRLNDPPHMPSWSAIRHSGGSTTVISKHASDVIGRGALTRSGLAVGRKARDLIDLVEPLDVTPDDVITWQRGGFKGPDPRGDGHKGSYFDFKAQRWVVRTEADLPLGGFPSHSLPTSSTNQDPHYEAFRDPEVDPTTVPGMSLRNVIGPDPVALNLLLQKSIDETEYEPEGTVVFASESPETSSDEDGYLTLSDAELAKLAHTCDALGQPIEPVVTPPNGGEQEVESSLPPRSATPPLEPAPSEQREVGDRADGAFRCPTLQESCRPEGTVADRLENLERVMDLYNEFFQHCFRLQARLMVEVHLPLSEDDSQPTMGSEPAPDGETAAP